jgi:hypothetical protein
MSKIFRRPMFRGGSTNNKMSGIMSGIQDTPRTQYSNGSTREKLLKIAEEYPSQAADPLGQFLIQGGLNLLSGKGAGKGTLGSLAESYKEPTTNLFKSMAEKNQMEKNLALQGELLDIEQAREQDLLAKKLAGQKELAEMELGTISATDFKDYLEQYQGSSVQAKNRADYENQGLESKAVQNFGESYEGFIGGIHGKTRDYEKKANIGKVYYDVTDGTFKRLRKTADGYSYESINMASFDPEADKAKVIPKEKFSGERSENPSYRRPPKENIFKKIKPADPFDPSSA